MPTINIPDRMSIGLPYGAPDIDVDLTTLIPVMEAIVHYGITQKLGDKITGGKGREQFDGMPDGPALHQAVTKTARGLLDDIIAHGWKVRAGGGGRKLSDPIDVWVRDEAERAARQQIARGTAFIDGRKVVKALPADVKVLRDRLMADPGWVALARAAYRPPIEAPTDAGTILAEPGLDTAKAA